ncbi:MAG: MBL fold metallo-hydrolase [Pyrinomonadaceae bacterium MAG19_C2-C3]|nr:MBL fold metallo-hydrolase [Pyrinomonadaceae bacterium MAG19_C2-C3]
MQNSNTIARQTPTNTPQHIAHGLGSLTTVFVNLYFIKADDGSWTLVDTGLPLQAWRVRAAAEAQFGQGARPSSIILTHGHFDHAGNALALAESWDVPIYAHRLEMPYLTGKSDYPPQDPTVGGALAQMSRVFPVSGYDFKNRVQALPDDGTVPGLPEWVYLHTPGHTAGHISLFRERDRVLITGDALATVNQESLVTLTTLKRELRCPPAPLTTDWDAAQASINRLAALQPSVIAAGHGLPIDETAAARLERFARNFTPPAHGRYVNQAAQTDETGVVRLPPPVSDPVPKIIAGATLAVGAGLLVAQLRKGRSGNGRRGKMRRGKERRR